MCEAEISSKNSPKWHKKCFVPGCLSSSNDEPSKVFIRLPQGTAIRKQWAEAVGRKGKAVHFNAGSGVYCCGDHFNLKEDAKNWMQHTVMGARIELKRGVLPHIFTQENQKPLIKNVNNQQKASSDEELVIPQSMDTPFGQPYIKKDNAAETNECDVIISPKVLPNILKRRSDEPVLQEIAIAGPSNIGHESSEPQKRHCSHKNLQCNIRAHTPIRSKGTQVDKDLLMCSRAVSPIIFQNQKLPKLSIQTETETETSDTVTINRTQFSTTDEDANTSPIKFSSELESDHSDKQKEAKSNSFLYTKLHIQTQPRVYTGLSEEVFPIFMQCMQEHSGLPYKDILLTLKKIRTNLPFRCLADDFGITPQHASRIFTNSVHKLASHTKHLILWSESETIKKLLPIPFRSRYRNVQSIIDCFEIEIEKPTDPVHQALTWSEYKKCNTLKYLISSTPDGLVNYISPGYGGRITDKLIVEVCGYLDKLPRKTTVMADRGFKHIEETLKLKDCTLVRPPSVSATKKSTKSEVKESKRIASLRIHIERVIRRLREFEYLKPHACINNKFIALTDYIVIIVCAIVNLQGPLIKSMYVTDD